MLGLDTSKGLRHMKKHRRLSGSFAQDALQLPHDDGSANKGDGDDNWADSLTKPFQPQKFETLGTGIDRHNITAQLRENILPI